MTFDSLIGPLFWFLSIVGRNFCVKLFGDIKASCLFALFECLFYIQPSDFLQSRRRVMGALIMTNLDLSNMNSSNRALTLVFRKCF